LKRGETSGRSDDQDEETIRNRVKVYEKLTAPLADYYRVQDKYSLIEGEGSVNEITDALCKYIDRYKFHQQEEEEEE